MLSIAAAAVIPCYKVTNSIAEVVSSILEIVNIIYIIDDCCPDSSGKFVADNIRDKRIS